MCLLVSPSPSPPIYLLLLPSLSLFPSLAFSFTSLFCLSYLCLFQPLPLCLAHTPASLSPSLLPPLKVQIPPVKSPGWAPTVRSPHFVPTPPREIYGTNPASSAFPPALDQLFSLPGDYLGALACPPASHPPHSRQ